MNRRGRPTLEDVARLAGVSLATASKALNDKPEVRSETKERVVAAAQALAFSRNSLARGLSRGRSGIVGLLTSDLEGRFSLPVLMGAEDAFGAGEVSVLLTDARGDRIREQRHLETLLSRRVDGLLVVGGYTDPRPPIAPDLPIPVVYVHTPSQRATDLSLTPDNEQGGRLVAEHLIGLGRRRIAHITGVVTERSAQDRAVGIATTLAEHGLSLVVETDYGEWSERWGRAATRMILREHPEIDAIICDADQVARGALDEMHRQNLAVPEDIALIGFDNWYIVTGGTDPGISTVDMELERLGREAARRLFAAIEGGQLGSGVERLPCRLVLRGSTLPGTR